MVKYKKIMISGMLVLVMLLAACFAFAACGDTEGEEEEDPYANIIAYNEETAESFRFEAEEAVISAPVALKCAAMPYQGNGHVVKAAGGFAAGHFMQADPSGSGTTQYGSAAYVGYMGAAVGDKITFEIESKAACVANIIFQGKSSLYMTDGGARPDSNWNADDTPIYVNGEKQAFEDTFFMNKVWSNNVELTGLRLKKGKNIIEIVAARALSSAFSTDWFDGTPRSAFPDLDFIGIDASVGTDNFTFANRTLTNEVNTNGYYTGDVCLWVDSAANPAQ